MAATADTEWLKWVHRIASSKNNRTLWEAQVATTSHFAAGIQKVWWDDEGNIREKRLLPGEIWRTINLFPVSLNIIQSRLTMNDPHWVPKRSPNVKDVSDNEIHAANALLQAVWDGTYRGDLSLKRVFKLGIRKAYVEGGSLFYHRFDETVDMPVVDLYSLWDTYSDEGAEDIYNKGWIAFSIPKSVEWIKRQVEESGWTVPEGLAADGVLAESQLKQDFLLRKSGPGGGTASIPTTRKLIFAYEYVSGGIKYSVIDRTGVLYEYTMSQYTSLCDLFTIFHPVDTGDFYARPPTMDWVDPQKSINKLYSSIECYIDTFGQGKWILDDDNIQIPVAGVHGQKILAPNGGLTQLPMLPLPGTHFEHLKQAISQFEQISGVHSESLGRQSGSVDSGKGLAQLQALDEQNSSDPVDNFKMCMQQVGCKILRDAADNWSNVKQLYRYDRINQKDIPMNVMGEKAYKIRTRSRGEDTIAIRPFEQVGVEIDIGKYFSKTQKQENLTSLLGVWQPGMNRMTDRIELPILIEAFDIGVGEDIVKELKKLEDPNQMIMEGKALLIADGDQVIINASDNHAAYAGFYQVKAEEYTKGGDQKAAKLLTAQASLHLQMQQEMERQAQTMPLGAGAPASIPEGIAQTKAFGGRLPIGGNDAPMPPAGPPPGSAPPGPPPPPAPRA